MNSHNSTQVNSERPAPEVQNPVAGGKERRWTVIMHDDGCTEINEATVSNLADGEVLGPFIYLRPWRHEAWQFEVTAPDIDAADLMACDIADQLIFN